MIRLEPGLMEFREIFTRHFFDAGDGAGTRERVAVGVARAVQERGKHAQRHLNRRSLFALDGGDLQFLLLLEIVFGEDGIQDKVGIQLERRIQFRFQRRQPHHGQVEIGVGGDLCAKQRLLVADLQGVSCLCAATEKRHGHR